MARAVGRVSSCGWVGAARVIADSAHCCQASILAVWLGCMRKFVAARTVKVEELRLSEPSNDCIAPRWCCWSCWGCCLAGGMWGSHFVWFRSSSMAALWDAYKVSISVKLGWVQFDDVTCDE